MLTLFADWFTYTLLRLPKGRLITEAIHFFVYDIPKIYLLLVVIVFVVAMLRTWIPAEKIKRLLVHRHQFVGNILAVFVRGAPYGDCVGGHHQSTSHGEVR